jgi:hypothetical protein
LIRQFEPEQEDIMRVCLLLLVVAGLAVVLLRSCSADVPEKRSRRIPAYSWGEMCDIFTLENELDERVRRMQLFREVLLDTEQALLTESLPLSAATEAVLKAARQNNPAFLEDVAERYNGMSAREQVALSLVQRLTLILQEGSLTPEQARAVGKLCQELAGWPDSSDALREHLDSSLR